MKKGKNISVLIFAVFMVMAFVPVVWAERGITDTEIRIGQWAPKQVLPHCGVMLRGEPVATSR